jgi:two-component system OmpR family response regulator
MDATALATDATDTTARATVLIVEDEPGIADILRITLRYNGFTVHSASTGREAVAAAREHRPDLVLLDVMLPDGNGWEVCRTLREQHAARIRAGGPGGQRGAEDDDLAIIFVTARDAPRDVVAGLALGGDDYITKPFGVDEVVARVHAVLRRTRRRDGRVADRVLRHADLEMDEATYTVRRAGRPVELTPTEYNLLRHLLRNAGRILTKEQLLQHVWQYDTAVSSTVVETYISYLRRKLDRLGPPLIETRRGIGYGLRAMEPGPAAGTGTGAGYGDGSAAGSGLGDGSAAGAGSSGRPTGQAGPAGGAGTSGAVAPHRGGTR